MGILVVHRADGRSSLALPYWLVPIFLMGAVLALGGGFWDDAWHTERGRDSFFIAPHVAIYSGVALSGAALGMWAVLGALRDGVRVALGHRPLRLALLAVAVTLASAPADNAWHTAFGRDAVIWSPPHVLGIAGTAALAVAVLAELVRSGAAWARPLRWVVGGLVLLAFTFLVVEYETDVPQFAAFWYLPVLSLVSSIGLAIVRLATGDRFAATKTALAHLLLTAAVSLYLLAQGFDVPALPLLVLPALVLDLLAARDLATPLQALGYVVALFATYLVGRGIVSTELDVSLADVAVGVPLAAAAVGVVLALVRAPAGTTRRGSMVTALAAVALACLSVVPVAMAHDPGQGAAAGSMDIVATARGYRIEVAARPNLRGPPRPVALIARRGGSSRRAPLRIEAGELTGSMRLTDAGRWFIYLDVTVRGRAVESWIPLEAGSGQHRVASSARFAYYPAGKPATTAKYIAGAVMYGLMLAFLIAVVALIRQLAVERMSHAPGPGWRVNRFRG